jgi:hypothetical protein
MKVMHGEASYKLQVSQSRWFSGPLLAHVSIYDGRKFYFASIPVAARSKALVCDRSFAWIAGSNPA